MTYEISNTENATYVTTVPTATNTELQIAQDRIAELEATVEKLEKKIAYHIEVGQFNSKQRADVASIIKQLIDDETIDDDDTIDELNKLLDLDLMEEVEVQVEITATVTVRVPRGESVDRYGFEVDLTYQGDSVDLHDEFTEVSENDRKNA